MHCYVCTYIQPFNPSIRQIMHQIIAFYFPEIFFSVGSTRSAKTASKTLKAMYCEQTNRLSGKLHGVYLFIRVPVHCAAELWQLHVDYCQLLYCTYICNFKTMTNTVTEPPWSHRGEWSPAQKACAVEKNKIKKLRKLSPKGPCPLYPSLWDHGIHWGNHRAPFYFLRNPDGPNNTV